MGEEEWKKAAKHATVLQYNYDNIVHLHNYLQYVIMMVLYIRPAINVTIDNKVMNIEIKMTNEMSKIFL